MTTRAPRMASMTQAPAIPETSESTGSITEQLETLLTGLLRAHEHLLDASSAQRDAVRTANPAAIQQASDRQANALRVIAALEDQRRALVNSMTAGLPRRAAGAGPVTLTELANQMPEPQRTRLIDLAARVRTAVELAANEQRTLKAATTSLVAHMEGLMRQVARRLSHAGTYGRRGMIESTPAVVSGLDLLT